MHMAAPRVCVSHMWGIPSPFDTSASREVQCLANTVKEFEHRATLKSMQFHRRKVSTSKTGSHNECCRRCISTCSPALVRCRLPWASLVPMPLPHDSKPFKWGEKSVFPEDESQCHSFNHGLTRSTTLNSPTETVDITTIHKASPYQGIVPAKQCIFRHLDCRCRAIQKSGVRAPLRALERNHPK